MNMIDEDLIFTRNTGPYKQVELRLIKNMAARVYGFYMGKMYPYIGPKRNSLDISKNESIWMQR